MFETTQNVRKYRHLGITDILKILHCVFVCKPCKGISNANLYIFQITCPKND